MSNFGAFQSRKQLSRAEREEALQRYILIGSIVIAAVVVLIIGAGIIDLAILQPQRPVARVNGQAIPLSEFQKRVRFQRFLLIRQYTQAAIMAQAGDPQMAEYFQQQASQVVTQLDDLSSLGQSAVDYLIEDALIRAEAQRRGITVTPEEIEARMRENFGFFPDGTATPTVTPTDMPTSVPPTLSGPRQTQIARAPTVTPTSTLAPTAVPTITATPAVSPTATLPLTPTPSATPYTEQAYLTEVNSTTLELQQQASFNAADLRYWIESQLYREKVAEAIGNEISGTEEQVEARHILVADEITAMSVITQLQSGGDWDVLAAQYSTDTSNKDEGGYLGWFPRAQMVAEFSTAAFSLTVGSVSTTPVQTQFGYHIIQVLAKEERPLDSFALESARGQAFEDWLAAQRLATRPEGTPVVETYDDAWRLAVPDKPDIPRQ